jgi:lysozyme
MIQRRTAIGALVLSASALVGIAVSEGYRGTAYDDGVGVQTIGFGTTEGVKPGDKTDPVRSLIRLNKSASVYSDAVKRCAPVPMYQYEFDALVSLTYNIGPDAFCRSTVAKKMVMGDYKGACDAILLFNRAGGKVNPGLVKRREAERKLCLGIREM